MNKYKLGGKKLWGDLDRNFVEGIITLENSKYNYDISYTEEEKEIARGIIIDNQLYMRTITDRSRLLN